MAPSNLNWLSPKVILRVVFLLFKGQASIEVTCKMAKQMIHMQTTCLNWFAADTSEGCGEFQSSDIEFKSQTDTRYAN